MKIQNVDRLKRKLRRFPEIVREEIRAAISQSADEMVELMKRTVPVDKGDLRDSIGWTWGAPPRGALVIATSANKAAREAGLVATIFAGNEAAYYVRFIEFGTVKARAQPFFFPSYRLTKKRARARITRATTKAAKKVAAGG
jgi:HK97 gp10 family phage protein